MLRLAKPALLGQGTAASTQCDCHVASARLTCNSHPYCCAGSCFLPRSSFSTAPLSANIVRLSSGDKPADDTAMTDIVAYCCNLPVPQPPSPSPPPPPAIDCIGSWTAKTACNSTCTSPGLQIQTYVITTAAANGGAACPFANGTTNSTICSAQICPVNCVGSWTPLSACSATACGTTGVQTQTFVITTAAANGGAPCAFADGTTNCTACSAAPCPVNCIGSWSSPTPCNASCGGGATTQTFTITTAAANGGSPCPFASGTTNSTACNTQACAAHVIVSTIKPSIGGAWGTWSSFAGCPAGSWAAGARMRVEPSQGSGKL